MSGGHGSRGMFYTLRSAQAVRGSKTKYFYVGFVQMGCHHIALLLYLCNV